MNRDIKKVNFTGKWIVPRAMLDDVIAKLHLVLPPGSVIAFNSFTGAAYALLPIARLVLDGLSTLRSRSRKKLECAHAAHSCRS